MTLVQASGVPRFVQRLAAVLLATAGMAGGPALAQSEGNPSGLPLPRFASTATEPINVRVGPGTRYDVVWVYVRRGQPLEIIAEFDTWRQVRDVQGDEGWIHQSLLSGNRTGLITPWAESGRTALRSAPEDSAGVVAWLTPGFHVNISECDSSWCAVSARSGGKSFRGNVPQDTLWGVYPNETFD